ncbi:MAG: ABC transporter substrate-binding protein [Schwartzia sp. (in: firmicutes)]
MHRFHRQLAALAALLCAFSLLLGGCGGEKQAASDGATEKRIVKDIKGHEVEAPKELKRIAVAPLPWASVVDVLDGGSERMVAIHPGAMSAYRGHFLSTKDSHFGTLDTQLIGQDFSVHVEGMLEKGIEAVILWSYQDEVAAKLKQVGIAPVMINNANVEELQKSFLIVGQLLGKEARAEKVVDFYQKTYADIKARGGAVEKAAKPKVLFLRTQKLRLQGNDNFMREAIAMAGGDNPTATQALKNNQEQNISMEDILNIDPDIILLSNFDTFVPDDLYENRLPGQDWSTVKAVRDRRVYKVPMGIYRWDAPGVETPLMMRWLARLFQPEIFSDIEIRQETKAFMKDFMGYDLSEADLAQIFTDEANKNSRGAL